MLIVSDIRICLNLKKSTVDVKKVERDRQFYFRRADVAC